ncbi:MAG: sulfotransferase [Gammaproteobacteria bacterium]|nr:sulfotransferase [Gammaproteobacteria bacterium]MDH5305323.1 sulfotransferase [Gammaproteobacteria bacterium]MDH5323289.1 sulfotransferase [Gammaproteobacteria bacterium]
MIVKPVLIIGAPRSGTSMLQKILRNRPEFWSLPSESDMIWDRFCHPALHAWQSESLDEHDISPAAKAEILAMFETYMRPAGFWRPFEKANLIWGFRRIPAIRKMMRAAFESVLPILAGRTSAEVEKRLLEKTASNCFRLGYVNEVFPQAKIIYPTRDGRNNVNSLINAWRHEERFFTYDVPQQLHIEGYALDRWKFVLPPGWRDFTNRPLAEVCAFQWRACHEAMLSEISKQKYSGRVLQVRLEDLAARPGVQFERMAEFLELPYDAYFKALERNLPVVNSPDNDASTDKWQGENRDLIEQIMPMIAPTMRRLGYDA